MSGDSGEYFDRHRSLHWEREHASVKSVATKSGAKATTVTIVMEVTAPWTLADLVRDATEAQRDSKPLRKPAVTTGGKS
jgi:hypothetical protein